MITQLDHEANRGPWLSLRSEGIIVKEIKLLSNGTLDYEHFTNQLSERTRLVCMGWASNFTGTINDIHKARKLTYEIGSWLLIDAVHYAPHFRMDVKKIGCDFLLCSAYKFYGPHVGLLYAKTGFLDRLPCDRLRTTDQHAPYSIETGTLNHAAIAGVHASIEFIESLSDRSENQLDHAFDLLTKHERGLAQKLYDGIRSLDDCTVIGPGFDKGQRAPTISFTHSRLSASEVCSSLRITTFLPGMEISMRFGPQKSWGWKKKEE